MSFKIPPTSKSVLAPPIVAFFLEKKEKKENRHFLNTSVKKGTPILFIFILKKKIYVKFRVLFKQL